MSDFRIGTLQIPGSPLGGKNPLPVFKSLEAASAGEAIDESVPSEDREYLGTHLDTGCLPFRLQDDYDRSRQELRFLTVVLENEILRATFLPELGGRLWSLFHKPTGREMLEVNPVFQPANLAIRNAWFSGGVEWNSCVYGHSAYGCSPMFSACLDGPDGTKVLRMYEWHRTRCVPFQMDFYLPSDSHFLFLRVGLINPHDHESPTYWWSNMSVPESPDMRVIVPADQAFTYEYGGKTSMVSIPYDHGHDVTYPTNSPFARDYFFRIPDGQRPWIAALDKSGCGLIHASTSRLVGRKLFAWGMNPGGRRWQEFISGPGSKCEIQAGLARTQMECLPMPPHSQWCWLEAFGLCEADPAVTHGSQWHQAVRHVNAWLDEFLPQEHLEEELARSQAFVNRPPDEFILRGSGWGALERRRREKHGERAFCGPRLVFDDASMTEDQQPWLKLLEEGVLPCPDSSETPGAWMIQDEWRELVEASLRRTDGDHWLAWLHLGLMHYANDEHDAAEEAWCKSLRRRPNTWAYRNLAQLAKCRGASAKAADLYLQAYELAPQRRPIVVEYCGALLEAGRAEEALKLILSLPSELRRYPRIQVFEAQAAIEVGDLKRAKGILTEDFELPDVREGETILTDLWFAMHERRIADAENAVIDDALRRRVREECPPPANLDFRVVPS